MKQEKKTAKAAVFMGANMPFEVREFEIAQTPAGYGRMELIASGICGTDVHFHKGKLSVQAPTIIGHEFVGKITDLNAAEGKKYGLQVGDNVIADIAVPCGECLLCKTGDDANCVCMKVTNGGSISEPPYLYGGYTEVNYTPLSNLIKIPARLDPVMVTTFACPGPTAMHAFALAERAGVNVKEKSVAVVQGLGPVGMFAVMYLHAVGVKTVFAVTAGNNPKREQSARELGATEVLNLSVMGEEAVTEFVLNHTNGLGADFAFEASGAPAAVSQGMQMLRNRGVYLVPGQYSNSGGVNIQPQLITFKALHIIGSSQYSVSDVKAYLDFLCEHPELHAGICALGNKYTIEQINEAFDDAKSGNNIKTMLVKK
ncbi:MAG: alcohol dehydrogenase catalytic domain-containing protein [Clostridia bacterium]|nr:alcohol dehydrogenase catalytic domain-containing protein [Clostridia bacterium]